jgi:hypothetical protein
MPSGAVPTMPQPKSAVVVAKIVGNKLLNRLKSWWKSRKQIKAQRRAQQELINALKSGNYTLAAKLRIKLVRLPCPTCGKNIS